MIHVIATITCQPGKRAEVLEAFRANTAAVRAEAGCIEYCAVIDLENGPSFQTPCGVDTFVVVEKWESLDALKAHARAPHMSAYSAKVKELLAGRDIRILQNA